MLVGAHISTDLSCSRDTKSSPSTNEVTSPFITTLFAKLSENTAPDHQSMFTMASRPQVERSGAGSSKWRCKKGKGEQEGERQVALARLQHRSLQCRHRWCCKVAVLGYLGTSRHSSASPQSWAAVLPREQQLRQPLVNAPLSLAGTPHTARCPTASWTSDEAALVHFQPATRCQPIQTSNSAPEWALAADRCWRHVAFLQQFV